MPLAGFRQRHVAGPGGMAALWTIALPLIVSQGFDTAMMFIDRLYLAHLGKEHLAACMSGGLTAFLAMTLPVGVVGYVSALVAHHYGAGQPAACTRVVTQGLILALLAYPFLLLGGWPLGHSFVWLGHHPAQAALELEYYQILLLGSLLGLLRAALAGFFAGIGRTRIIMLANALGLVVNVGANYVLIFGKLGFPEMRMAGAAWGTVLSSAAVLAVLAWAYVWHGRRDGFAVRESLRWDRPLARLLLRYGLPCGIEFCLNVTAFTLVVGLFHAYGPTVAASVTIAFNWDLVAFLPMIGVQTAVMALVGQHLGAGNPAAAERAAYSGMKIAWLYAGTMIALFLTIPGPLVRVFTPAGTGLDYAAVVPLARRMLMLASVYILSDGTFLVFSGALRGAGDTLWAMWVSVALHWGGMAGMTVLCTRVLRTGPLTAWSVFVVAVAVMGGVMYLRFRGGAWKSLRLVGAGPGPGTTVPVEPVPGIEAP